MKAKTLLIGSKPLNYEWAIFVLLLRVIETIWKRDLRQCILEGQKGEKTKEVNVKEKNMKCMKWNKQMTSGILSYLLQVRLA